MVKNGVLGYSSSRINRKKVLSGEDNEPDVCKIHPHFIRSIRIPLALGARERWVASRYMIRRHGTNHRHLADQRPAA